MDISPDFSPRPVAAKSPEPGEDLEKLLEYLKRNRGFDFTGYKRTSLDRRIRKRMDAVAVRGYPDYIDYLEVHPDEFNALFNTILINVTAFFRDPATWTFLAEEVIPELIKRKDPRAPIRVWSAGCATGEEAYTLAMIFSEILGKQYRDRVKIYGTDADEDALARARMAAYGERDAEGIPPELREKYFDHVDSMYIFKKDYRRQVIFGRHDLIQDAPISRVDLLVCRNALMYFNAETQARIISRFHFALNEGGILFLGRAETLLSHSTTFAPIDIKRRISTKVPSKSLPLRDRLMLMAQNGPEDAGDSLNHHLRIRDVAIDLAPIAQIVVDAAGAVVQANERARSLFGLSLDDVGRPLQDLRISYRPVELRSLLEQVAVDRRTVLLRDVEWPVLKGENRWFDVQVVPLLDGPTGPLLGSSISFVDTTIARRVQIELERTHQELESTHEELQSTNEELETTNEELQSTVEELETTNEELQSTNEELVTMNEELQSTNEELTTINDELRVRSTELNQVNAFLESVLTAMRGGLAAVDGELRVMVWNRRAEDLWGLREDEVIGKHFLGLEFGLDVDRLKQPIRACLAGARESLGVELDAINRRGQQFLCRVTCSPLLGTEESPRGVIVLMEDAGGNGKKRAD
jgi:two-component system, chemotaxis family, CheB/CheR fusion protein